VLNHEKRNGTGPCLSIYALATLERISFHAKKELCQPKERRAVVLQNTELHTYLPVLNYISTDEQNLYICISILGHPQNSEKLECQISLCPGDISVSAPPNDQWMENWVFAWTLKTHSSDQIYLHQIKESGTYDKYIHLTEEHLKILMKPNCVGKIVFFINMNFLVHVECRPGVHVKLPIQARTTRGINPLNN